MEVIKLLNPYYLGKEFKYWHEFSYDIHNSYLPDTKHFKLFLNSDATLNNILSPYYY
ncbi:MAG: hypothetical protein JNM67_08130 [Bacteroidetes bacterium]|nr:hypothetical protein [Bacteroidota bacterium]